MSDEELKEFQSWLLYEHELVLTVVKYNRPWCDACDDARGDGDHCDGHVVDQELPLSHYIDLFRNPPKPTVQVTLTADEIWRLHNLYDNRDDAGGNVEGDTELFAKLKEAEMEVASE